MNTIIIAAVLAFSATVTNAQSYYNNDYVRGMDSTEYQIYDRAQRQIQQSANRMYDERMQEQQLQKEEMSRMRREMELDATLRNSRYR